MDTTNSMNYWNIVASKWEKFDSPLIPSECDLERYRKAGGNPPRVLILGVTPQLARLYPQAICIDSSEEMIKKVAIRGAVCGDWLNMPFADSSFDLILGDNVPTVVGDIATLSKELRRVLRNTGRVVFRDVFRPEEAVEGTIPAVVMSLGKRVRLSDVYDELQANHPHLMDMGQSYKDCDNIFEFFTREEMRSAFAPDFEVGLIDEEKPDIFVLT